MNKKYYINEYQYIFELFILFLNSLYLIFFALLRFIFKSSF